MGFEPTTLRDLVGCSNGGSWVQIPSGARIFSEFSKHLIYHVFDFDLLSCVCCFIFNIIIIIFFNIIIIIFFNIIIIIFFNIIIIIFFNIIIIIFFNIIIIIFFNIIIIIFFNIIIIIFFNILKLSEISSGILLRYFFLSYLFVWLMEK